MKYKKDTLGESDNLNILIESKLSYANNEIKNLLRTDLEFKHLKSAKLALSETFDQLILTLIHRDLSEESLVLRDFNKMNENELSLSEEFIIGYFGELGVSKVEYWLESGSLSADILIAHEKALVAQLMSLKMINTVLNENYELSLNAADMELFNSGPMAA